MLERLNSLNVHDHIILEPVDYSKPPTPWYDTDALLGREFGIVKYILRIFCFVHSTWWEI